MTYELAIIGGGGMLGQAIARIDQRALAVGGRLAYDLTDVEACRELVRALANDKVPAVINAAGIIDARRHEYAVSDADFRRVQMLVNGIAPQILAEECQKFGIAFVQVSTDCVFSGDLPAGMAYTVGDVPDPIDYYGLTKAAGEVEGQGTVVVRTSFVGATHGLVPWFRDQAADVDGWRRTYWSGSTVEAVARRLLHMVNGLRGGFGYPSFVHLATPEPISKYDLLRITGDELRSRGRAVPGVRAANHPTINRALEPGGAIPLVSYQNAIEEDVAGWLDAWGAA
jgi:dTDP-4-dehydrorhamnose reductase